MSDNELTRVSQRNKRLVGAAGLLLAGGLAGGALAATTSASAADSGPSSLTAAPAATAATTPGRPADTATSVRAGEKALTGSDLAMVRAAALKAVPGGIVYRAETDSDGAVYEAHMSKADGTRVTVKLDKSFAVTAIQEGMGAGGPGGHPNPSDPPGSSQGGAGV